MKYDVIIIKPDHIGDYILFRNFLYEIKNSKKFATCKITLVGNSRVRDLAEFLDYNIVDKFIWIDLEKLLKNSSYFLLRYNEITKEKYNILINGMFSRFNPLEKIIRDINANEKFLIKEVEDESKYDINYTNIINLSKEKVFEFYRFKIFFERLLDNKINLIKPNISLIKKNYITHIKNYIVVFIGADASFRKWNIQNYINLIAHILNIYKVSIVLCGGQEEKNDANFIENRISSKKIHNLIGCTTLVDMLYILKNSRCVISNETGIPHMSIALDIPTIVISNGNNFGKFTPYPKSMTELYIVKYPFALKNPEDYIKYRSLFYDKTSCLDIDKICFNEVIEEITNLFFKIKITKYSNKKKNHFILSNNITCKNDLRNSNLLFSQVFSRLYVDITLLKDKKTKYLLYGNSNFSKIVHYILEKQVVGITDKSSNAISIQPKTNISYSTSNIPNFVYDKIIVCVLGREEEIIEHLFNEFNISIENIVIFKAYYNRYI